LPKCDHLSLFTIIEIPKEKLKIDTKIVLDLNKRGVGQFIDSQFIDTQFIDSRFIDTTVLSTASLSTDRFIDSQFIDSPFYRHPVYRQTILSIPSLIMIFLYEFIKFTRDFDLIRPNLT
jgi:hypothetical protein